MNKEPIRLKYQQGNKVAYDIDYLLGNLSEEIYLLKKEKVDGKPRPEGAPRTHFDLLLEDHRDLVIDIIVDKHGIDRITDKPIRCGVVSCERCKFCSEEHGLDNPGCKYRMREYLNMEV